MNISCERGCDTGRSYGKETSGNSMGGAYALGESIPHVKAVVGTGWDKQGDNAQTRVDHEEQRRCYVLNWTEQPDQQVGTGVVDGWGHVRTWCAYSEEQMSVPDNGSRSPRRDLKVAACDGEHVGDELRCDEGAALVLLVHASIREIGHAGSDHPRRHTLAGGDEDGELREVVVDIRAARLDDVHILITNGLVNLDVESNRGSAMSDKAMHITQRIVDVVRE